MTPNNTIALFVKFIEEILRDQAFFKWLKREFLRLFVRVYCSMYFTENSLTLRPIRLMAISIRDDRASSRKSIPTGVDHVPI